MRKHGAACRRHLRARQLRPRGNVREVPDRDPHRRCSTSSAAPSISSVYASKADLEGVLFIAISQSGASPDLLAAAGAARDAGALVIALVNAEDSPLARTAHHAIPLRAGVETSVAATKSYIASLAAIVDLVASWTQDRELHLALEQAPDQLVLAWQLDWGAATEHLRSASSLFVIGRGLGLGIAQEAALKLKETCGLHAEAFSAAELRHGPMALVRAGFPIFAFLQNDETREGVEALAQRVESRLAPTSWWPGLKSPAQSHCRRCARIRRSNRC